jgi:hypothetical protein
MQSRYKPGLFFLFLLMITGLLAGGCRKQLDKNPLSQYSNEAFWGSQNDALLALAGVYRGGIQMADAPEYSATDWWSYYGLLFLEFATDNAYDRRGDNSDLSRLTNGTLTATNGYVGSQWTNSYSRIARCNYFIENVGRTPMDTAIISRMTAEARFIRACQYFYLSQFWGSVPLVTHTLTLTQANTVTKAAKADVMRYAMSELQACAQILPRAKNLLASEKGRATQQAALAFLGRLQLAAGAYGAAAATYSTIVLAGDNMIDPNFGSLFDGTNESSKEIIFATQYLQNTGDNAMEQHMFPRALGGYSIFCPLGSLSESYEFTDGTPFSFSDPRYNPADIGQNRDPRLKFTILYNNQAFGSITYQSHPDSVNAWDRTTTSLQATRTGFCMKKFNSPLVSGDLQNTGIDLPLIRYSEVLLSYLEARLENGDAISQSLLDSTINQVRGRVSVNMAKVTETNPANLRVILRRERRNELALEGIRMWDLLRWGIAGQVLNGAFYGAPFPGARNLRKNGSVVDPYGRWYVTSKAFRIGQDELWPVPQNEVAINPNLK